MNVRIPASIFRAVIGLLGCLALACVGAAVHAQATYVVQPGDTLSSIAARHNISYITLAELNGLAKPYVLQVGQTLTFASPPPRSC